MLRPCQHLDYDETKYGPDITIESPPGYPQVRFWHRGPTWTEPPFAGLPPGVADVQFCKLRGRIKGILQCYQAPGPVGCYAPLDDEPGGEE